MQPSQKSEIRQTTNYELFKFAEYNREIDHGLVKMLVKSIGDKNLLHYRPIEVNQQMEVLDGQHRLMAAKTLQVPIYYRMAIDMKAEDVVALNNATRGWKAEDFIRYYATMGIESYRELLELMKKWSMSATQIISLIGFGDKMTNTVRKGTLSFNRSELEHSYDFYLSIAELIKRFIPSSERQFLNKSTFMKALSSFIKIPGVCEKTLLKKMEVKMNYMRLCTNTKDYLLILQQMYNYHNRNPIELSFDHLGRVEQYDYKSEE